MSRCGSLCAIQNAVTFINHSRPIQKCCHRPQLFTFSFTSNTSSVFPLFKLLENTQMLASTSGYLSTSSFSPMSLHSFNLLLACHSQPSYGAELFIFTRESFIFLLLRSPLKMFSSKSRTLSRIMFLHEVDPFCRGRIMSAFGCCFLPCAKFDHHQNFHLMVHVFTAPSHHRIQRLHLFFNKLVRSAHLQFLFVHIIPCDDGFHRYLLLLQDTQFSCV